MWGNIVSPQRGAAGRLVAAYFLPNIENSLSQRKISTLHILDHLTDVRKKKKQVLESQTKILQIIYGPQVF